MNKKRIAITFLIVLTNAIGVTAILPMLPSKLNGSSEPHLFKRCS